MPNKPHVQLNTSKQFDKPVKLVFNFGNPQDDDDNIPKKVIEPDYSLMAKEFRIYLDNFKNDRRERYSNRNPDLNINIHFDYIKIKFKDQFNLKKYFSSWMNDCGLMAIEFNQFNHQVLFASIDEVKFAGFLKQIDNFINKESGQNDNLTYAGRVTYIESFELLKTSNILMHYGDTNLINVKLVDFPLNGNKYQGILNDLSRYLNEQNLTFEIRESNLEVINASVHQIKEIVENFDIVLNVTSGLATIIGPDNLNLPQRSYGFEIENTDETLPIIGILDTGISALTPLAPIIIKDADFNLTATPSNEDNADEGQGHGTGIGALAALGKKPYAINYRGSIRADAKLLSMKILDGNSGYLSYFSVLDLLRKAKAKYPEIKLFVLTICYNQHKWVNESHSAYAFEIDRFAHENDCLIFVSTANNMEAANVNTTYDLGYFNQECTNICVPADSMNNLVVGAAAHSLKEGEHQGISTALEFPALYTRKSHIDFTGLFPVMKMNKAYFRPDVIEFGGDYEFSGDGGYFGQGFKASMDILSANAEESFYSNIGTSFSAPLVANIAAKIQLQYPNIRAQSIKALIINGASVDKIRFGNIHSHLQKRVVGHGLVDEEKSVQSNDNRITFLIEDEIEPEKMAVFPINFPSYLVDEDLGKKQGILIVTATLCFSFEPVMDNQTAYCPIHMAFCFFKNHTPDNILKKSDEVDSLLKSSVRWSQNGRYKSKPIPAFNTHKIKFSVNKDDLINEDNVFKLGVNCRILHQMLSGLEAKYQKSHPFSLVITIEENLVAKQLTDKLYDEMTAINEIINISIADVENNLDLEV